MKRGLRFAPAGWIAVLGLALPLEAWAAEAPRVVSVVPDMGDVDVDPKLHELRIVFDRDMLPAGYSVCTGGPTSPVFEGRMGWQDARTFVTGIKLEPGHDYGFSVNCRSARGFQSTAGVPAEPYGVLFRTRPLGIPAVAVTPEQKAAVMKELRRLIAEEYSYRDRLGVDWQAQFDTAAPGIEAATSRGALARALATVLAPAQDPHLQLDISGLTVPTAAPNMASNFDRRLLLQSIPTVKSPSRNVAAARYDDGIGYLLINSWKLSSGGEDLQAVLGVIASFSDTKGIVLDVRPNGGGDEAAAQRVAGCFVGDDFLYARDRIQGPNGLGPMNDRIVAPTPGRPRYSGRVALLIGPVCMSSNESFIMMMRGDPQCRSFGARTRGSSGGPRSHDLGVGISVLLPSWQDYFPDGTLLEGKGIEPDVPVEFDAKATNGDPVLAAALEWLRR